MAALDSWLAGRASAKDTECLNWSRLGSGRNGGTLRQHDGTPLLLVVRRDPRSLSPALRPLALLRTPRVSVGDMFSLNFL